MTDPRTETADVIVAGGGHNSLITAAYLARAGKSVIVVDARPIPGGGMATEELLPGYFFDTCSTGHTIIQANPVIDNDSLGLIRDYGLTYVDPDPVARVALPDGEQVAMHLDAEATIEEFARFSRRDADTYRAFLADWDSAKKAFNATNNSPIGWGPSLDQLLDALPNGGVWRRRRALSAWDVIRHEFEEEHIRAFLFWEACQTFGSVDLPGSGAIPYSTMGGRQARSWTIPLGGSGRLGDALVGVIEANGGRIVCNVLVDRLLLDDGRCAGVESRDGTQYLAREAVVSTIHVNHLIDMAPKESWDESFTYGVKTYDLGIPMFAMYLAMTEAPTFIGARPTDTAVSSGLAAWPQDVIDIVRDIRDGKPVVDSGWTLVATPSLVDPSRAPQGRQTVKILVPCSKVPPRGASSWDEAKEEHADRILEYVRTAIPNINDQTIEARIVKSPMDIERSNPHMIGGCPHGGDKGVPFSGPLRPAAGWASHRLPIRGLYQTGGTTHPGGSITGFPGRNAAMVVMKDLGLTFPG